MTKCQQGAVGAVTRTRTAEAARRIAAVMTEGAKQPMRECNARDSNLALFHCLSIKYGAATTTFLHPVYYKNPWKKLLYLWAFLHFNWCSVVAANKPYRQGSLSRDGPFQHSGLYKSPALIQ
jgi:hypothetical protein